MKNSMIESIKNIFSAPMTAILFVTVAFLSPTSTVESLGMYVVLVLTILSLYLAAMVSNRANFLITSKIRKRFTAKEEITNI